MPVSAQTLSILHAFRGGAGGATPAFQLVEDAAGNFYGTTQAGGAGCQGLGCGVVYRLSRNGNRWTYTELYKFSGSAGASNVTLDAAGNLYGELPYAGSNGAGLVFELSPTATPPWTFTTLYTFTGGSDGAQPIGGLVFDAAGNLYGASQHGGALSGSGTVFELSPQPGGTWTEQVLYAFSLGSNVGFNPGAGVIFDPQGNLYGTTDEVSVTYSNGTVYKLTKGASGWTATSLYQFTDGADGSSPEAPLAIDAAGNLYGTTAYGGKRKKGTFGDGTVYELSPDGSGGYSFQVIHTFGETGNSFEPVTIDAAGNLYGVADGGTSVPPGFIFKLTNSGSSWTFTPLHGFNGSDGYQPDTLMIDPSGNIFGVTNAGGIGCANEGGCGVVFELTQP